MTYAKLIESNNVYCKISKSTHNIADKCAESFYLPYISNSIVCGSQISFVEKKNILTAFIYGDTYTEFNFKNDLINNLFKNDNIIHVGGGLDEYRANRLLVGNQYSLNDISTIMYIVKDAQERFATCAFSKGDTYNELIAHFKRLDMQKAISAFEFLQDLFYICKESKYQTISAFKMLVTEYFEKECILKPIFPQPNKEKENDFDR